MQRRYLFLVLAVVLFVAWTGFITWTSLVSAAPIVVSQPQIYVAPVVVEADVEDEPGEARTVTVHRVYRGHQALGIADDEIAPKDLRIVISNFGTARGWQGPGDYILALTKVELPMGHSTFDLLPTPLSPGFPPVSHLERLQPAVYPVTPSTRAQTLQALKLSETGGS